eukprot:5864362-Pleurochrysis_carterae.AAC.1
MPIAGPPVCEMPRPRGLHVATGPRPWPLWAPPAPTPLRAARHRQPLPGVARHFAPWGPRGTGGPPSIPASHAPPSPRRGVPEGIGAPACPRAAQPLRAARGP